MDKGRRRLRDEAANRNEREELIPIALFARPGLPWARVGEADAVSMILMTPSRSFGLRGGHGLCRKPGAEHELTAFLTPD